MITKVYGPPGTGKTTYLLNVVAENVSTAKTIGFFSFTRKASEEAKSRCFTRFNNKLRYDYFKSIHAFCYKELGIKRHQVMDKENYIELGIMLGIELSGSIDLDTYGMTTGDRYFFIENLARTTKCNLLDLFNSLKDEEMFWGELERLSRGLKKYKESRLLLDYTDMLQYYVDKGPIVKFDLLLIDEAQDLSHLQWEVVDKLMHSASKVYLAGDDDQAIYKWAGADTTIFNSYPCDNVKILDKSYRVPNVILKESQKLIRKNENRVDKTYLPTNKEGSFRYINDLDELDLSTGNWLLLARNGYLLKQYEEYCELNGYPFSSVFRNPLTNPAVKAVYCWEQLRKGKEVSDNDFNNMLKYTSITNLTIDSFNNETPIWHKGLDKLNYKDREYYISILRRGESILKKPRIHISTIHSIKGGECDNVVINLDMSRKTYDMYQLDVDNEIRVFYVAMTRAIENCYILTERTNRYFECLY